MPQPWFVEALEGGDALLMTSTRLSPSHPASTRSRRQRIYEPQSPVESRWVKD